MDKQRIDLVRQEDVNFIEQITPEEFQYCLKTISDTSKYFNESYLDENGFQFLDIDDKDMYPPPFVNKRSYAKYIKRK